MPQCFFPEELGGAWYFESLTDGYSDWNPTHVFVPISIGEAVFWGEGEVHETETESGLTAIVLEAPGLGPFRRPE